MSDGSIVVSVDHNPWLDAAIPYAVTLDWTSGADGGVSQPIAATLTAQNAATGNPIYPKPNVIQGKFRSCETIPGALGVPATNPPTGAYTIKVQDKYGDDLLNGNGAAQSVTLPNIIAISGTQLIVNSELTLVISGAGNAKQGRAILTFEDAGYAKL